MTSIKPFPMVELALKELIERDFEGAEGKVGGDLAYDPAMDFYVWLGLVPGGAADLNGGEWVVDIDVFGMDYTDTMQRALALEAVLVGPRKVTSVLVLDQCYQNTGPSERPWDAEDVFRIGATYVFTARRPG